MPKADEANHSSHDKANRDPIRQPVGEILKSDRQQGYRDKSQRPLQKRCIIDLVNEVLVVRNMTHDGQNSPVLADIEGSRSHTSEQCKESEIPGPGTTASH